MRNILSSLVLAPIAVLAACDQAPPVYVGQAYVRINPNPDAPSAAYFTIQTGDAPVALRDVLSEASVRVEMHEMVSDGGMMKMRPVDSVDIPAKSTVRFEPGGKHVMMWSINPQVVETGKVPMTLIFSNGDRIIVEAVVQKPGPS
jgi:copper(I)-binding protein